MSEATRDRLAVLQHKRVQSAACELLGRISDALNEPQHAPIAAEDSLRLQRMLYAKLPAMRTDGSLRLRTLADALAATVDVLAHIDQLGRDVVFEVYTGARGSGFFSGPISGDFLKTCLEKGYEGFAAVLPSMTSGVILDVVIDDPLRGDFYETECW